LDDTYWSKKLFSMFGDLRVIGIYSIMKKWEHVLCSWFLLQYPFIQSNQNQIYSFTNTVRNCIEDPLSIIRVKTYKLKNVTLWWERFPLNASHELLTKASCFSVKAPICFLLFYAILSHPIIVYMYRWVGEWEKLKTYFLWL